eukprot:gene40798-64761_t
MKFEVEINVMPLKDLLDPQGKAVLGGLANLGITEVKDVRVGKHITLSVEAASAAEAKTIAENASKQLLANQDITLRSLEVLNLVDLILCEDTRTSSKLLQHYNIQKPLSPYHQHNEHKIVAHLADQLEAGKIVALITD